jgi:hypothetical protein
MHYERAAGIHNGATQNGSAMSCSQLLSRLSAEEQRYEVEVKSKKYQVEVKILENKDTYIQVIVAVDDGHFWRAMHPASVQLYMQKRRTPGRASIPAAAGNLSVIAACNN